MNHITPHSGIPTNLKRLPCRPLGRPLAARAGRFMLRVKANSEET